MCDFAGTTARFLRQIQERDSEDGLIANTRLNDSTKLMDFSRLVIKTQPRFFFQKPKYRASDWKLEDLFGGRPPRPEWFKTSPFLIKAEAFAARNLAGKISAGPVLDAGAKVIEWDYAGSGPLNKLELVELIKVQKSINNVRMKEKPQLKERETLLLVKDRIFTTTPWKLEGIDEIDVGCILTVMAKIIKLLVGGTHRRTEANLMEIPPNSVIAYSVTELKGLNVQDLQADGIADDFNFLSEDLTLDEILIRVWKALQGFKKDFQLLAGLPQETKTSLFLQLCEIRKDSADSQKLLEHMEGTPHESAVQLLVSALEELPEVAQDMLARCSPECLLALNTLVTSRKNKQSVSLESLPHPLQDGGEFNWATEFICSFEKMQELDTLWEITGLHPGVLLLVLCIAVQGLAAVCGCV